MKRKLQHNKTELKATGGGPNTQHSFNDLEESIIRLLSLERTVNHSGKMKYYLANYLDSLFFPQIGFIFGTAGPSASSASQSTIPGEETDEPTLEPTFIEEPTHEESNRENDTEDQPATRGRGRANKRNFRKVLLEKQTDDLCKMKRYVSDCARYARKSCNLHEKRLALEEKRFHLEEEKFRFEKQVLLEKQNHKYELLQYHLQMLEFKKEKLDFERRRTAPGIIDIQADHEMDRND